MTTVTLVEQHHIQANDPRFAAIDAAAFAAKNLYNKALYVVRQAFIHEDVYIPYTKLYTDLPEIYKEYENPVPLPTYAPFGGRPDPDHYHPAPVQRRLFGAGGPG
jgi:hypothetical protein